MANSLYDFATSEASNSTTGGVNTAENQAPSTVNDAMRAWKQLQAGWLADVGGPTVGGSATALTVTLSQGFTAYGTGAGEIKTGTLIVVKTASAATGAATIAVNGLTAKAIRRQGDAVVQAGDWAAGANLLLEYGSTLNGAAGAWLVLNRSPGSYFIGGTGMASITQPTTGGGIIVTAGSMNTTTNKYTPPIGFGSTDADLTTLNPKVLAGLAGRATQAYNGDTTGGMAIDMFLSADTPGATPTLAAQYTWTATAFSPVTTGAATLGTPGSLGWAGLAFPATQVPSADANTLDDYQEEDNVSSTITATTGTFTSVAGSIYYTKIGRLVTGHILITITTPGTAADGITVAIPAAIAINTTASPAGTMVGVARNSLDLDLQGMYVLTSSSLKLMQYDGGAPASYAIGQTYRGTFSYFTS